MSTSQQKSKVHRRAKKLGSRPSESDSIASPKYFYAGVAAVLAGYAAYPSESNPLYPAIFLSYPISNQVDSGPQQYGKGPKDVIFVAFYSLVLFAVRDFISEYVAGPIATFWGVTEPDKRRKFKEQFYPAAYFAWISVFGLYVMKRTPMWFFNMPGMLEGFPHETHDAPFKAFYLVHSANWVHHALVTFLGYETLRKDTLVVYAHHIVTLIAIPLIYYYHMTWFALALIIPHDISDSLLCLGKCITYIGPNAIVAFPYFTIFVGSWIYFRHWVGSITFWTLLTKYKPALITAYGWQNEQWKATTLHGVVVGLFGALQIMNAYWLYLILIVVAKAASGSIPKDERESEDEDDIKKDD